MSGAKLLVTLAVMWFGASEIQNGRMTIGDYVVFMTYTLTLTGTTGSIFYAYTSIQPTLASLDRLVEMFKIVPEYDRDQKGKLLIIPDKIYGEIKYENVSFSYEVNKPVLTDICFTARQGETIALVGPSGAGKTTLVNLMLKFYSPQNGRIFLDGKDLKDIDPVWLRRQISIVSQDIFLFDDTIENNIKYGRPSASHEEVIEAAKMARIHGDIMQMPNGYDTKVGERGMKLSTGQRQRVSIARAFLKNSPILIFDEPTSALDVETEQAIKESLKELVEGKTTFIISHRMTMVDVADRILVVSEGKIVQDGTHKVLSGIEGQYKMLCA
jgi:subfamily B ATP-binding cassette protein MsbA